MTILLPQAKRDKISNKAKEILGRGGCSKKELQSLIGTLERSG